MTEKSANLPSVLGKHPPLIGQVFRLLHLAALRGQRQCVASVCLKGLHFARM